METRKEDGQVLPLILLTLDKHLIWAGITNEKGYKKSLEQGEIWALDNKTGKLLSLADHDERFPRKKYLDSIEMVRLNGPNQLYLAYSRVLTSLANPILFLRDSPGKAGTMQKTEQGTKQATARTLTERSSSVLHELEALVAERKQTMPEGSYTSHLFKAGLSKIRKKTGEEAVELILAQSKEEIKSEAADLLYHLMVLLAATEVSLDEVLVELSTR